MLTHSVKNFSVQAHCARPATARRAAKKAGAPAKSTPAYLPARAFTAAEMTFAVMRIIESILLSLAEKVFWEKKRQPTSSLAHAIKNLLDENIFTSVDIAALAEKLHISKSTLFREFSKHYNVGPYQYLLLRKIEIAKTFLIRTENSIKDIANRLAFSDEFYFSNIFKQKTGVSPSAWRKEQIRPEQIR